MVRAKQKDLEIDLSRMPKNDIAALTDLTIFKCYPKLNLVTFIAHFPADLVTFTVKTLNGKLPFFCRFWSNKPLRAGKSAW